MSQGKAVSRNEEGVDAVGAHNAHLSEDVGKVSRIEEDPVHREQGRFAHATQGEDDLPGGQRRDVLFHHPQGIPVFLEVGGEGLWPVGMGGRVGPPEEAFQPAFEPDSGAGFRGVEGKGFPVPDQEGVRVVGSDQDQVPVPECGKMIGRRDRQINSRGARFLREEGHEMEKNAEIPLAGRFGQDDGRSPKVRVSGEGISAVGDEAEVGEADIVRDGGQIERRIPEDRSLEARIVVGCAGEDPRYPRLEVEVDPEDIPERGEILEADRNGPELIGGSGRGGGEGNRVLELLVQKKVEPRALFPRKGGIPVMKCEGKRGLMPDKEVGGKGKTDGKRSGSAHLEPVLVHQGVESDGFAGVDPPGGLVFSARGRKNDAGNRRQGPRCVKLSQGKTEGGCPDFPGVPAQDQENFSVGIVRIVHEGQGRSIDGGDEGPGRELGGGGHQDQIAGGEGSGVVGESGCGLKFERGALAFHADPGRRDPGGFEKGNVGVAQQEGQRPCPGHGVIEEGERKVREPVRKMDPDSRKGDPASRVDPDKGSRINPVAGMVRIFRHPDPEGVEGRDQIGGDPECGRLWRGMLGRAQGEGQCSQRGFVDVQLEARHSDGGLPRKIGESDRHLALFYHLTGGKSEEGAPVHARSGDLHGPSPSQLRKGEGFRKLPVGLKRRGGDRGGFGGRRKGRVRIREKKSNQEE